MLRRRETLQQEELQDRVHGLLMEAGVGIEPASTALQAAA